jgi:ABC-2 type transport system permease protein
MRPLQGFAASLRTLLALRIDLHFRGLRARSGLSSILGHLEPFVLLLFLVLLHGIVKSVVAPLPTLVVAAVAALLLVVVHLVLVIEVITRVGRGGGMAAALYQYPLSPMLIHSSEVAQSVLNLPVLGSMAALLALLTAIEAPVIGVMPWLLFFGLYLASTRALLQLAVAHLLRNRRLREISTALVPVVVLVGVLWVDWMMVQVATDQRHLDLEQLRASIEGLPASYWLLPCNWLMAPFAPLAGLQPFAPLVAVGGMSMMLLATFLIGAVLQERACLGEGSARAARPDRTRLRRGLHLSDRLPFSLVQPAIWATMDRELKELRRDPAVWVLMVCQASFVLLPPLLLGGTGAGLERLYLPSLLFGLLLVESVPAFNVIAKEGRALHFLVQAPVPRWQVFAGKNLAYGLLFGLFNVVFLGGAALVYGALGQLSLYLLISSFALVLLLGLGNAVSVFLPEAAIGARAAEGGSRAAHAASEGGGDERGCLTLLLKLVCLQGVVVLAIPPTLLVVFGPALLGGAGHFVVAAAVMAYTVLVYLAFTGIAIWRLKGTEEQLLLRFAGRAAI